uniref:Uncharacterized protein n=1 Tax=Lactuca sativa TaxID=4236 RepID=A0A9R1XYH1_LACSA|nr:hypothetical protein LSAT_V11C100043590 [Lactuca sativa]
MAAASISTTFLPLYKPIKSFVSTSQTPKCFPKTKHGANTGIVWAVSKEQDVIPVQSNNFTDHQVGILVSEIEKEVEGGKGVQFIGGFGGSEGILSFEGGFSSASTSGDGNQVVEGENIDKLIDRTSNTTIVLAAGTFGITKLLTIDYDYWHVKALKENPLLAKMMISEVVYSIGDWIAQVNHCWSLIAPACLDLAFLASLYIDPFLTTTIISVM